MTKKEKAQQEAVNILKEWGLVDGVTVHAKVNKVSRSGMFRRVALYIVKDDTLIDISYWSAKALEWSYKEGYDGGIGVSGCGMDMLFHTVESLSYSMGYGSLCQDRDRTEPIEKGDIRTNRGTFKAIGLKYKQI